jgi:hypothetical protein
MKEVNTAKGAYEIIQALRETPNCVGIYKYTLSDGEEVDGYVNEMNYEDIYIPFVKINCNNGYVITTNYKDYVDNIIIEKSATATK